MSMWVVLQSAITFFENYRALETHAHRVCVYTFCHVKYDGQVQLKYGEKILARDATTICLICKSQYYAGHLLFQSDLGQLSIIF